ncbi:MAG TPA: hypothetical protein VK607_13945 [Kofleriaceae bacterium]|nr:hypothetical protein [Kofleriaceae bacterium]
MIIRRAMLRALQWRLLLISPIVLLVAATATLLPLAGFLGDLLDHSPRWRDITASLDWPTLAGIAKALMTPAAAGLAPGIRTSVVLAVLFAPLLAGAALFVAEAATRPTLRELLSGAAGYYPRLVRLQIAALVPLGIAAGIAVVAFGWAVRAASRATSDAATHTSGRIAWLLTLVAVFVAQLVVDAARARFAAEPARRSAVFALGAGVKLVVKRPLRAVSIGLASTVPALLVAAVLLVVRQQITQASTATVLLALVLAQLAVAAIAWGHAAKLCGLVELAHELATSRLAATAPGTVPDPEPAARAEPAEAPAAPAPAAAAPPIDPPEG